MNRCYWDFKELIMKVLVMYYSKTGNTKKLAQEIVKGVRQIKDLECILKSAPKQPVSLVAFSDSPSLVFM